MVSTGILHTPQEMVSKICNPICCSGLLLNFFSFASVPLHSATGTVILTFLSCECAPLWHALYPQNPSDDIKRAMPSFRSDRHGTTIPTYSNLSLMISMSTQDISQQLMYRTNLMLHLMLHFLQSSSSLHSGTLRYIPDRMLTGC